MTPGERHYEVPWSIPELVRHQLPHSITREVTVGRTSTSIYAVVATNGLADPGLYRHYSVYAHIVRDHDTPWNGREDIPFARGTCSKTFQQKKDAVRFFYGKVGDWPIQFW